MNHIFADPVLQGAAIARALVVMLHLPGIAGPAGKLAEAWRPVVPAARIELQSVPEGLGADATLELLGGLLDRAGLPPERVALVGVCGAEDVALQLALRRDALAWAGLLLCGSALPPLTPLADISLHRGTRLRLIWQASDPLLHAVALGELLRWIRVAGLDAQGCVLEQGTSVPDGAGVGCAPSPALVRLGGAYLAELIATALHGAPQLRVGGR
jgi:hypothetical protein